MGGALIDYVELLDEVHEVVARAADGLTPGATDLTRLPVMVSRSSVTGGDVRFDRIGEVWEHLHRAVEALPAVATEWGEFPPAEPGEHPDSPLVKAGSRVPRTPVAAGRAEEVTSEVLVLVARLRSEVDDIVAHPLGHHVTEHLDELARTVRPARPERQPTGLCRTCGEVAAVAAVDRGVAACGVCGKQIGEDAWLDVNDTARQLGCSVRTLRRMIAAGEVDTRYEGRIVSCGWRR